MKTVTINISSDIHRNLKVKAAQEGKQIKTLVEELILKYLED